jgi:hypothetical protein
MKTTGHLFQACGHEMKLALPLALAILIAAPSYAAEYRHGDPFTIPAGAFIYNEPQDNEEPQEACDTANEDQVVNLWGKPSAGWCLLVHWIDSGRPGYSVAAWKAWVDCKVLTPLPPPKRKAK